jgi:predicted aspartyl protease
VAKAKTNTFAGKGSQEMGFAKAESLQIGSIQIRSVPVMIVPTIRFTEAFQDKSYPVGAVIGVGLLRQFLATIDYPFNRLILRPKSAQGRAAFGKSMAAKKAAQVSFALAETHVIISNGEINDREVTFFVDSGMKDDEAFFLLRKETFKYLQIRLPKTRVEDTTAGGSQTRHAQARFRVDKLTLGEVMRRQVIGIYGLMPFKYQELGFMLDGIISHQFLRNYSWTLDFEKRVMYLAKF